MNRAIPWFVALVGCVSLSALVLASMSLSRRTFDNQSANQAISPATVAKEPVTGPGASDPIPPRQIPTETRSERRPVAGEPPDPRSTEPPKSPVAVKSLDASVSIPTFQINVDKADVEAEAFRVAEQLLTRRPNDAQALHVAAVCNSQFHKTTEAQRLWLKCIELSPKTETYYLNVAANALFRGDTELALATLEKAEASGIQSADIAHHMGLALTRLGEDERAVEVLKRTLQKDSNLAAHWMLLGQSELKLGRLPAAKESLNKAVELGAKSRALYLALLNTSVRLGEKDEAARYRVIIESMGDKPTDDGREQFRTISDREAKRVLITVLGEACVVYRDAGLIEDAEHTALRLLAHDPDSYGTCLFLAELYQSRQLPAEELVARQRMLEINPSDIVNQLQVARILADTGHPQRCEAAIKLVIAIAPQQALGYAAMAEFLVSQGLPQRAQWYAEQALVRERSPAGFKLLAAILRAQGKETEAQSVEKSATNNPVPAR